ncbi:response regulator [Flavobacteriaceae bacterium F89]|uniref:histidine kinase n=1 Tax=Cerina litoralis TaxID=2874477 RepID=A0AAE3EWQ0_9FLAO|nr:two-component regulator propeller domain-containing protein [Cerina litoralis]MCG2462278.1 response regulator [Cerina litoralis]
MSESQVAQDSLGYIWISSVDGLYKYDGYDFRFTAYTDIFGTDFNNSRKILFSNDKKGNLWLATYNGELAQLTLGGDHIFFKDTFSQSGHGFRVTSIKPNQEQVWFGSNTGTLYRYNYLTSSIDSIMTMPRLESHPQQITDIAFTGSKHIWLSTQNGLIYDYSLEENKLTELEVPLNNPIKGIVEIVSDERGHLWISTEFNGLFSYNLKDGSYKQYDQSLTSGKNSKHAQFICLFYDNTGKIWAGTDGYGLYRIDLETDSTIIYRQKGDNKFSISNNTIMFVGKDAHENLWAVTKNGHINILPADSNKIKYYSGSENGSPTPVLSILKTSEGSLWIGTDGNGINRIFPDKKSIQYNDSKTGANFFEGRFVQKLVEDSKGNIWIGTYQNGLFLFAPGKESFKRLPIRNASGQSSSDVRYLYRDSKNRIWATSSIGIHIFSENQEELATFEYGSHGLAAGVCQSLTETSDGEIWVGQDSGGLFRFLEDSTDFQKSTFKPYKYYEHQDEDLNNYDISSLLEDKKGNLWVLCMGGFLIRFSTQTHTFESYLYKDLIKDINISSILVDDSNNLWLSSDNGLHEYNSSTGSLKSYYRIDGLQGDYFKRRSAFKSRNGTFYFGGENGVSAFVPKTMKKTESTAKLYINDIEVLNKPASTIIPDQLTSGAENVKSLKLQSGQSSFSFRFSAIENVLNANYNYAYRLLGFSNEWVMTKTDRRASYTNIPHGDYTFEVKAGTKKGEWDIGVKQIHIIIKPYWWQSNLAFAIYTLFLSLLVLGIILWIRLRNRLHREEWQYGQEKELYALKMNFFAKMSHEIHTPLTLILAPIDDMLKRAVSHKNHLLKQRLNLIKNNAERLRRISNELMTVRNRELGKLRIYASRHDIVGDLKKIASSFVEQARFKEINFIQEYTSNEIHLWYDREKMEHVFYNLLSNAFKFTARNGEIVLKVNEFNDLGLVAITISDTGLGISQDELDSVFELFYQSETGKQAKGLGIGLALSKEMIDLHHGNIIVSSKLGIGTKFTVELSMRDDVFTDDEKMDVTEFGLLPSTPGGNFFHHENDLVEKNTISIEREHVVLVVEDNVDMQIFLKDLLHGKFEVLIAENGKEGIASAKKNNPAVIISDVMMPIMDGVEMSRTLQKSKQTSHIPIILLTAKKATNSKLVGLQSGAIAYIQKPFDPQELLLQVHNIISRSEKIIFKTKTELFSVPKSNIVKSKDHIFMENLVNELNGRVEDSQFKLEDLANTLNMSYSVIYRKCQELTGKTLVEFFRSLKVKRAALFILENGYSISEAAFMVGYKDSRYFTKCFKEEFGKPPTALKREIKEIGLENLIKKYKIQTA